ncbi:AAA family ATPase [Vibrio sp. RE86]|uniref:ExeA family protein n=1 Tax=Vibrio sp. RE86 TaxID=2607605 RepID=UPI001493C761|nr:ExeA family protein [Vibrio sp. RE86]NOH81766.1 AAA family ATPase [Vibrio sp. RE86]
MYLQHFALTELPFSIVPNSRFLYQSRRHKEAIFQLQAGLGEGGGFAMLTGEVGTGKTTIAKSILKTLSENVRAGLILNPTFSNTELLEAICDEFDLTYEPRSSLKQLNQTIYQFLLSNHANRIQTLLVIDEAQHLSAEVLEQLRLLTNLETESQKLLKVLLIGQPELQQKLQMPQLRQLAQRMTGRYHLLPLNQDETRDYIKFRLSLAGGSPELFPSQSIKYIAQQAHGIPRLINLVCDASLKRAYSLGEKVLSASTVEAACNEVMSFQTSAILSSAPLSSVSTQPKESAVRFVSKFVSVAFAAALSVGAYVYTPQFVKPFFVGYLKGEYPKVEQENIQKLVFPSELTKILERVDDRKVAIADLYKVWGYRATILDKQCLSDVSSLFHCEQSQATLEQLMEQDVPSVLLLNVDGQERYAVLSGVSDSRVQLLAENKLIEFDKQWLNTVWEGQYISIWKTYWNDTLQSGMQGEPVRLLDKHLSFALGKPESDTSTYDAALKHKVELFQRWQGLTADGIAGEQTLRLLEKMSQMDSPNLSHLQGEL